MNEIPRPGFLECFEGEEKKYAEPLGGIDKLVLFFQGYTFQSRCTYDLICPYDRIINDKKYCKLPLKNDN